MNKTKIFIFTMVLLLTNNTFFQGQNIHNSYLQIQQPVSVGKGKLHIFPAPKRLSNGCIIMLIPGGRYARLAIDNEGFDWVPFLNSLGYTATVLQYTMPKGIPEIPIRDACEAMRYIRLHSKEWNIENAKVGVFGFSAGGHLASMMTELIDSIERPDFAALFYPVITMDSENTHKASRENLFGEHATKQLEQQYSSQLHISSNMPNIFMALSADDRNVNPINSLLFFQALIEKNNQSTLHIYPSGRHGWGFSSDFKYHDKMLYDLTLWLKEISSKITPSKK